MSKPKKYRKWPPKFKFGPGLHNPSNKVRLKMKPKRNDPERSKECPGCGGEGKYVGLRVIEDPCGQCGGTGRVTQNQGIDIEDKTRGPHIRFGV